MAIQNANPTILSNAQIPTRRKDRASASLTRTGPGHAYDDIIHAVPLYLLPPFSQPGESWLPADDEIGDDALRQGLTHEPIDEQEIYDLISNIQDPEHPLSLGQLAVVNLADIMLDPAPGTHPIAALVHVRVAITPTVSHCSHATVIGLAVRVRLERCLPPNYRVEVRVKESTHSQDEQVTKQLDDKERVAAALENTTLVSVLDSMLKDCDP